MTRAAEQLLAAVMQLEPDDRAELVDRLEESREPSEDPAYVAAWEAEVADRIAEIDGGRVKMVPWKQVRDRLGADDRDAAG